MKILGANWENCVDTVCLKLQNQKRRNSDVRSMESVGSLEKRAGYT